MNNSIQQSSRYLVWFTFCLLLHSCANRPYAGLSGKPSVKLEIAEVHAGILQGYLDPAELPNSLELLPPPPDEGSTEWKPDHEKAEYFVNQISEELLDTHKSKI